MFVVHKQSSGLSKIHFAFLIKGQTVDSSLRFFYAFEMTRSSPGLSSPHCY